MRRLKVGGHPKGPTAAKQRWAVVDDADHARLSSFLWCFKKRSDRKGGYAYRYTHKRKGAHKGWERRLLHHDVLQISSSQEVDHINGNGLDNRRSNLRLSTHTQNCRNQRKLSTGRATSRYKGVGKASPNRWRARIRVDGVLIGLGHFASEKDAARAYNLAAIAHFGEFARLNPVRGVRR